MITEYVTEPQNRYEGIKRFIERDRLQAMFAERIVLIASCLQGQGDSGSRHAMQKAKENCYLWTKASPHRVEPIMKYCKLRQFFNKVIFDDKITFRNSILKLEAVTYSAKFIIYDDNYKFFDNECVKIIDRIRTDKFDVAGYLIFG